MISNIKGKSVLIVDDEPELRKAMAFDFKRRGCILFEAGCGNDALQIIRTTTIDIVISDVRMPNGSGIDLVKEIRKINPKTPVVLLATGFADLSEPEALQIGAQALVEKPIDRKRMIEIIEQSLLLGE